MTHDRLDSRMPRLPDAEIERRRKAARAAIASTHLAGGEVGEGVRALMELHAIGAIDEEAAIARIEAAHGEGATSFEIEITEEERALIAAMAPPPEESPYRGVKL